MAVKYRQILCRQNQRCVNAHCRETVFVWKSNDSCFKRKGGQYEWSGEGESTLPIEEVWDTDVIDQMQADKTVPLYEITKVCGFEPSGSLYRVHWADYKIKKRNEAVHLQYIHESANAVATYLETTSGMRRMNNLRKLFNSRATLILQKSGSVRSWNYKKWKKQVATSILCSSSLLSYVAVSCALLTSSVTSSLPHLVI